MSIGKDSRYQINVSVISEYLPNQSDVDEKKYVFSYTITISNSGTQPAQLLRRHWHITDANDQVEEVSGDGVVGAQPLIKPGDSYTYTSGAMLKTEIGHMQGSYEMQSEDGKHFNAEISAFTLSRPNALH